jgi:hypothetical protein
MFAIFSVIIMHLNKRHAEADEWTSLNGRAHKEQGSCDVSSDMDSPALYKVPVANKRILIVFFHRDRTQGSPEAPNAARVERRFFAVSIVVIPHRMSLYRIHLETRSQVFIHCGRIPGPEIKPAYRLLNLSSDHRSQRALRALIFAFPAGLITMLPHPSML